MGDLGTIAPYYTYGVSINNSGQVAGNIETYVGGPVGVFVYSNGELNNLTDIADSSGVGWSQLTFGQMNDHGYIVGNGTFNGESHAFLARPYVVDVPTSYSIYRGVYFAGSLSSLLVVDGDYLKVLTGPTLNSSEAPISVVVTGTADYATPTDLRLLMTAHANTPGITQTIELWDFQASAWAVAGSQAATRSDKMEVAVGSNPARFVQAGTNAIKARVSWKQTGPTLIYRWAAYVDQIVWNVSP